MEKTIIIHHKDIKTLDHNSTERTYWGKGLTVCGIDEAGRGPLAGPVVAAAVIVPTNCSSTLLKDSKVLSEKARLDAYIWIIKNCHIGLGIETPSAIDTHNIYQATMRAMRRAFCQLSTKAPTSISGIIVDAMPLTFTTSAYNTIPVHAFTEAESRSSSVAAASIIAKVVRDSIMNKLEKILPDYQFYKHKGYGTAQHQAYIIAQGRSLIHRQSFLIKMKKNKEYSDNIKKQATIWGSNSEQP